MRIALIVAALLAAAPAHAEQDMIARMGGDSVSFFVEPCENAAILALIPKLFQRDFYRAGAVMDGQAFEACWRKAGDQRHVIYEDGDQGLIPAVDLKPLLGA